MCDHLKFSAFDSAKTHDMWDDLAEMRDRCPVVQTTDDYAYLARHADNERVFGDAKSFRNAGGWRESWVEMPVEDRFLGELDPPRHSALRHPMVLALSPRMATRAEPFTRAYVSERLARLAAGGGGDLVEELTLPMPQA